MLFTSGGPIAKKKFYQLNQYIKADTLRLVDSKAQQIGVVSKQQALDLAREKGLDVVLVAPNTKPPVAKLINFSNFKYQQKKKQKSGQGKKSVELKEVRLTPFIAENDLQTRVKKAREFLQEGDRVKINVKFVGRQITRKEFGQKVMDRVVTELGEVSKVDQPAKFQGKVLTATLKPSAKQKKPDEQQTK